MKSVAAFSLLCCALVTSSALALDPNAPEMTAVSVAPDPVNITTGSQNIAVSLQIADDEDGFELGSVGIYNPDGKFVTTTFFSVGDRVSGTPMNGSYVVPVPVPEHAIPGETWRIEVRLYDTAFNLQSYGSEADFAPHSRYFEVVHTNPAQIDGTFDSELGRWTGTPPAVATFEVSPATVAPGGDLTVRARITDAPAGFVDGIAYFTPPQGVEPLFWVAFNGDVVRDSGDAFDGVYDIAAEMSPESEPGIWKVHFFLTDAAGNSGFRDGGFVVVSSGGNLPISLGNAVDSVQYPWSSVQHPWTYQTTEKHDGVDAARSGATPDNGESVLDTYITGPGTLTFWWRTSSEEDGDLLWFEDLTGNQSRNISGDSGWTQETITLGAGSNHLRWTYAKNATGVAGQDCGWLDQARFIADPADLEPPTLQGLAITPNPVDIETSSQWVTFSIQATDDFNGISGGNLRVFDPFDTEYISLFFDESSRTEGDFRGGTYTLMSMIPLGSAPGTWRVEVDLFEGNSTTVVVYKPGQRRFPNLNEELFLVSDGTAIDTQSPTASGVSIAPETVDISSGTAGATTVTLRVIDGGLGATGFSEGIIDVYASADRKTSSTIFTGAQRTGGSATDGIYAVQVPVAAYGPPGTWLIGVTVKDASGNQRVYHPFEGDDPEALGQFTVVNTGVQDLALPVLTSIDITPVAVDVTDSAKDITITVAAGDNLSGLGEAKIYFYFSGGTQPIGSLTRDLMQHRISGDDLQGTYQVTVTIPQTVESGEYEVRTELRDRTGHKARYGADGQGYPQGVSDARFSVSTGNTGGSTYQQFTNLYGLTGNTALPEADPDGDGFNNATELLLGTHPGDATSNGIGKLTVTRDATHLHLNFTIDPTLDVEVREEESFLRLGDGLPRFRVAGQVATGAVGGWDDIRPEPVSGQTYRVSIPFSGGRTGFIRLSFTEG